MFRSHRREFLAQSGRVILGAGAGALVLRAAAAVDDKPAAVQLMLFGGDLPEVQKDLAEKYSVGFALAGAMPGAKEDNVRGLEKLPDCQAWIGSIHKRVMPSAEQLKFFQDFHAAGRPIVGYRAASHTFQNWLVIDKEVFGAKYGGHHLSDKDPQLVVEPVGDALKHPIFQGLVPPAPRSGSYVYSEIADDVTVLLRSGLAGDMMPHTWVREDKQTKGRVFYTRYDAMQIGAEPVVREIFLRGLAWAMGDTLAKAKRTT